MSHKPRNYAVTWTCRIRQWFKCSSANTNSAKKRNTISQISGTDWIYQTLESSANSRPLPCVLGAQRELAQRESIAMLKNVLFILDESNILWNLEKTFSLFPIVLYSTLPMFRQCTGQLQSSHEPFSLSKSIHQPFCIYQGILLQIPSSQSFRS